jgi:ferredoxin/coenzyme F420-reducing hydrogenase delta subunit
MPMITSEVPDPANAAQPHRPVALDRSVTHVRDANPGPGARGETVLRQVENIFLRLDARLHRYIPESLNPLTHSGAIANTAFLIAAVTGILLLIWYSPSVFTAYESLEKIREGSWLGQFVRSMHRYSSDACMFFILLHALRIFASRRIFGARWFAWVTGVALLGLMWSIGWTGYWLVWDVRAQHLAEGTARMLDFLPIFGQPLESSFLTNASVPSLLFFLVFFAHMLLPLAVGLALWLHLTRVSRPKLFTNRVMTGWIIGTLAVLSIVLPGTSAAPADMSAVSSPFTMDWWYLWPIALTDRLGGGALWALFLLATIAFVSVPWWMKKRGTPPVQAAVVDLASCHGCTLCSKDCPFDAISMVPRQDGTRPQIQAQVDADRCVGCGICTGSCDSDAISLPWLNIKDVKAQIDRWVAESLAREKKALLAFVCAESAGSSFSVHPVTGECPSLPGYLVKAIPCAGWVSPRLIEHCLQNGASGILVAGCGPGEQVFREGSQWLGDRLHAKRRPILRAKRADINLVRFVRLDRTRPEELAAAAADFRAQRSARERRRSRVTGSLAGAACAALIAFAVGAGSVLPYSPPDGEPELVISFRHLGEYVAQTRELSPEELERLPVHMRREIIVDRQRAPVRLRVFAGEELLLQRSYPPRGFRSDGPSVAMERIPLTPGLYDLRVEIGDTADADEWNYQWMDRLEMPADRRRVLLFTGDAGFELE